jgi:hypothetical protein
MNHQKSKEKTWTFKEIVIEDIQHDEESYCLVWCWKKASKKYIGIVNCY